MTPEKLLDLSVKFGVLPFLIVAVMITRKDLQDTKSDVKEMQRLLIDCYQDKVIQPKGLTKRVEEHQRIVAILPDKCKTIKECLS